MKNWTEIKHEFETDGSLRDIYIVGASESIWNVFINAVNNSYPCKFFVDGEEKSLPSSFSAIKGIQNTATTNLAIKIDGGILVNCHFFSDHQIELDLSPSDIANTNDFENLQKFMFWLHNLLKLKVVLTHENGPELEILTVE
ncbi:hypothetical protein ACFO4O_16395 [Glaciecola siphonariae]|uniref:Uncharacterized protein n=1 Tax=Glaciecola siphonariae TaxID=521012 RepID=A0ABV9LYY2_9ALTE